MKTLKIYPTSINERYLNEIVTTLRDGGLIVYPTDTMYALGCDALNNRAIERLCRIKDINPAKQHLSVVCSDISQAAEYARIDNRAFRLMKENLPGPFTFILPAATTLPKIFKGRRTVGIRIPDNPIPRAIAEALGNPVLSGSIELFELPSEVDLLIDGGDVPGEPSTVIDCLDTTSPTIVRQGRGDIDL